MFLKPLARLIECYKTYIQVNCSIEKDLPIEPVWTF